MDDIAAFNQRRWEELAQARVLYSRPWLDLTPALAWERLDLDGIVADVRDKDVLLLAGGGGQQSAAFSLLGARVTVVDLSETQLARDREAAPHYGLDVTTIQGDMRDLSCLAPKSFDIVYHPHSINFVPEAAAVFRQVSRVLREGGYYRVGWHNPFIMGVAEEDWDGTGYPLNRPYSDGEIKYKDPNWVFECEDGSIARVEGPREFRHTFSTFVNGLAGEGYVILALREEGRPDFDALPGSWEHFCAVVPPYLALWSTLRPDVFAGRPH